MSILLDVNYSIEVAEEIMDRLGEASIVIYSKGFYELVAFKELELQGLIKTEKAKNYCLILHDMIRQQESQVWADIMSHNEECTTPIDMQTFLHSTENHASDEQISQDLVPELISLDIEDNNN